MLILPISNKNKYIPSFFLALLKKPISQVVCYLAWNTTPVYTFGAISVASYHDQVHQGHCVEADAPQPHDAEHVDEYHGDGYANNNS